MKDGITAALQSQGAQKPFTGGGSKAAQVVVELMISTFDTISPRKLVDFYTPMIDQGIKPAPRQDALWKKYGKATISVMADGCRCLARMWQSAWLEGKGEATSMPLRTFTQDELFTIYHPLTFLPSCLLTEISAQLGLPATGGGTGTPTPAAKKAPAKKGVAKKAPAKKAPAKKKV